MKNLNMTQIEQNVLQEAKIRNVGLTEAEKSLMFRESRRVYRAIWSKIGDSQDHWLSLICCRLIELLRQLESDHLINQTFSMSWNKKFGYSLDQLAWDMLEMFDKVQNDMVDTEILRAKNPTFRSERSFKFCAELILSLDLHAQLLPKLKSMLYRFVRKMRISQQELNAGWGEFLGKTAQVNNDNFNSDVTFDFYSAIMFGVYTIQDWKLPLPHGCEWNLDKSHYIKDYLNFYTVMQTASFKAIETKGYEIVHTFKLIWINYVSLYGRLASFNQPELTAQCAHNHRIQTDSIDCEGGYGRKFAGLMEQLKVRPTFLPSCGVSFHVVLCDASDNQSTLSQICGEAQLSINEYICEGEGLVTLFRFYYVDREYSTYFIVSPAKAKVVYMDRFRNADGEPSGDFISLTVALTMYQFALHSYAQNSSTPEPTKDNNYMQEQVSTSSTYVKYIHPYKKRLPEHWRASEECVEAAKEFGVLLADNETIVRPHYKAVAYGPRGTVMKGE